MIKYLKDLYSDLDATLLVFFVAILICAVFGFAKTIGLYQRSQEWEEPHVHEATIGDTTYVVIITKDKRKFVSAYPQDFNSWVNEDGEIVGAGPFNQFYVVDSAHDLIEAWQNFNRRKAFEGVFEK